MKTAARTIAANTIDEVRGQIIGDVTSGALFYDGRKQGASIYGYSAEEVIEKAKAMRAELVSTLGGHPCFLYQDSELWEVRIAA
jgi:hypothetical protein